MINEKLQAGHVPISSIAFIFIPFNDLSPLLEGRFIKEKDVIQYGIKYPSSEMYSFFFIKNPIILTHHGSIRLCGSSC
jgi:hypothetical protein